MQFFFGFFNARHIIELHPGFGLHLEAGAGTAKAHGPACPARRSPQNQHQAKHQHQHQQRVGGNPGDRTSTAGGLHLHIHILLAESLNQFWIAAIPGEQQDLPGFILFAIPLEAHLGHPAIGVNIDLFHLALVNFFEKIPVGELVFSGGFLG